MYVFTLKKYLNSGGWEKCVNDNKDRDICMNGTVSDSVLQFSPDTMQWTQVKISQKLQRGLIRILWKLSWNSVASSIRRWGGWPGPGRGTPWAWPRSGTWQQRGWWRSTRTMSRKVFRNLIIALDQQRTINFWPSWFSQISVDQNRKIDIWPYWFPQTSLKSLRLRKLLTFGYFWLPLVPFLTFPYLSLPFFAFAF